MKAIRAIYEGGNVHLAEQPEDPGPYEVLVVFPETADDPWQEILEDPSPRPALSQWVEEVKREIAEGSSSPLNIDDL